MYYFKEKLGIGQTQLKDVNGGKYIYTNHVVTEFMLK